MSSTIHPEVLSKVHSFVDNLHQQAQAAGSASPNTAQPQGNGEDAAGETETPDSPATGSLGAGGNATPPALPSGGDQWAQLTQMLANAAKPPAEQLAAGNLPSVAVSLSDGSYNPVAVQSPDITSTSGAVYSWQCNQNMLSLAQLYSTILDITNREKRNHPALYNLSNDKDVWQIFADQADNTLNAMLGPLSGYYIFTTGETKQFSQQVDRTQLHAGFLTSVFSDFTLTVEATKDLDQVLTNFATAVGAFKLSTDAQTKSMNYTLKINTVPALNVTNDPKDVINVYIPTTTIVYMKIKATAWQDAMSACGSGGGAEHFQFDMTYTKTDCQLNMDWYQQSIGKFDAIMKYCTGQNLAAYGANLTQPIVNK